MTAYPIPDPRTSLVLATRNAGKIRELATLLEPFGLAVLGLQQFPELADVEETGTTFAENALLKACTISKATGLVALADDSGLEVDALDKAPGVYSARYSDGPGVPELSGRERDARNTQMVLRNLSGIPEEERTARFRCCMAACTPEGERLIAEGAWEGRIALGPAGENGFGYDPVFFDPELGLTAAQMPAQEKNARSHRGKAVAALLAKWPAFWQAWISANNS